MPKTLKIVPFLLLSILFFSYRIRAQESSPSATTASEEVTNNLKERLKSVVATPVLNNVATNIPRAYVGQVVDVIQNNLILKNKTGKYSVTVSDDATILRTPGSAAIKFDNIRLDDYVIAMGYLAEEDELAGRRLIVSASDFASPEKLSGVATIAAINRYSFTLQPPDSGTSLKLYFTKKTLYKSPRKLLEFSDLQVGDQVVYAAIRDADQDWSATVIMQIKATSPSPSPAEN